MIRLFTKNDIYRISGILLTVSGQFCHKDNFSGFGITADTNAVQLAGLILILLPFAVRYFQKKKDSA